MTGSAPVEQRLRRNISRYLAFAVLRGIPSGISIVLWVVFLQQRHGFTLTQVTLLDLPFWIGRFLFEIPTGVVADRFGRRLSIAVSSVLSSITWAIFAFIHSFPLFAIMQFIGAFGATFQSGADDALLYETMQSLGRDDEYPRIAGRARALETVSGMLAGVIAGWVATTNIVLPIIFASIVYALTLLPILTMYETGGVDRSASNQKPNPYMHTVHEAFQALRTYPILRWSAVYALVLNCVSFYVTVFLPPHSLSIGLPLEALGPVMVIVQLMGIAGSLSVAFAQKKTGNRALLLGVPILLIPAFVLAGLLRVVPVLAVFGLTSFLFALVQPVLGSVLHGRISNAVRATFLSVQSLLAMAFLIITEPGLGLIADRFGAHTAFLGMAVLLLVFCAPLVWQGRALFPAATAFPKPSTSQENG